MSKAVEKAFLFLSMRDHTCRELVEKLCRTFTDDEARQAADYLVDNGYIDEDRIAQLRTESYLRSGKSKKEIAGKLRMAGIERETIERLISDIDEAEVIQRQLERKYASKLAAGEYKKVTMSLLRRGFSYDVVMSATRAIQEDYN